MNPFLLLLLSLGGFMSTMALTSSGGTSTTSAGAQREPDSDADAPPPSETPQDTPAQAAGLTMVVWDMAKNEIVETVTPGETIDFGTDDTSDYTVAFETADSSPVGSMVLSYNGQTWLQNDFPYTLKPSFVDLSEGSFEVAVTAYSGANGTGEMLGSETVAFTTTSEAPEVVVVEEPATAPPADPVEEEEPEEVNETPATAPVPVDTPEAPDQSGDGGAGGSTEPIAINGTVSVMEGRVATLEPQINDIAALRILDGPNNGNVTVNPDGTFALVLTGSTYTGNDRFTYEATHSNGSTSTHAVNLRVTNGEQDAGWATGENHYILATDENDDIVVEHGDVHTKVYITSASKGLSRAEIANMEGINTSQVTGGWLANSKYGQSEQFALDENAGMMLWNHVTPSNSTTSNWLLLERGETYDDLGRLLNRDVNGESELHPLHIGAWGTGDRPEVTENFFQNGDYNSNIVVQGVHFSDGIKFFKYSENVIFDDIGVSGAEMAVQNSDSITVRNSDLTNISPDSPNGGGDTWAVHSDREQGLYGGNIEGLLIEGNFFDLNGWQLGYNQQNTTDGGLPPSQWSHNIYLGASTTDVTMRDTITMRGSSYGAQVRAGGFVEDNVFLDNNAAFATVGGDYKGAGPVGEYSLITDNLITSGAHKDPNTPIGAYTLGLADDALMSSLVDNIVTHLADPNNPDEFAERYWINDGLRSDDAFYDDTIVYNWLGSRYLDFPNNHAGNAATNIDGLDTDVLDQTTIQLYAEQLLGKSGATIDDLGQFLQAQAADGHDLSDISADDIIAYFQQGFGIGEDIRTGAETARFVPNALGEGVRWDNRLNWTTEDLPGTVAGDSVDLGGNHVVHGMTSKIDTLELGHSGELTLYGGRLTLEGGITGDDNGLIEITEAGQLWTAGSENDGLDIDIDGGRLVNSGKMTGTELTATGGQVVLATGGGIYGVSADDTLHITGNADVGFDDDDGGVALLALDEGATLSLDVADGKLGSVGEFRTGSFGDSPDVRSGIDLGGGTLKVDLAGLSAAQGNDLTLLDADELIGVFNDIDIGSLGGRNATVVIDYVKDSVSLELSSGNGQVSFRTVGESDDVSAGEQALWDALTAGQGVFDENPPEIPEDEQEYLEAS